MFSAVLALIVIAVSGLAYYMWVPLPDDLDQKGFVYFLNLRKKLIQPFTWIDPVYLGYSNKYHLLRVYNSWFSSFFSRPPALNSDPNLQVTNEVFNGVRVRVYRPTRAPVPTPVLMQFHGGGWCVGNIDNEDGISRYLAKRGDVAVISVEYRLAPEHPFPTALDDCVTATVHVLKHGLDLGLDSYKVGLTGFSAGGNLVAAVSLRLQEAEFKVLPRLSYQILFAPCLQGVDLNLPSYRDNDPLTGIVLSRREMAEFYLSYAGLEMSPSAIKQVCNGQHIGDKAKSKLSSYIHEDLLPGKKSGDIPRQNAGAVDETLTTQAEPVLLNYLLSPLLAPDNLLKEVPRAMVVMAHYDVLRDDAMLYSRRLQQLGVETKSHLIANGQHFSIFIRGLQPGSEAATEAYQNVLNFIQTCNSS